MALKLELEKRYGPREYNREDYRRIRALLKREDNSRHYLDNIEYTDRRVLIDGPRHLSSTRYITARGGLVIGLVAREHERFERAKTAADGKARPQTFEEFRGDEMIEINSTNPDGGQLLPILWETDPSCIIDTSSLEIEEVRCAVDGLLRQHTS